MNYNGITERLATLTLTQDTPTKKTDSVQDAQQASAHQDYERLVTLQIVDQTATVLPDFSFNASPTHELLANLAHFLQTNRSSGYSMLTVLKAVLRPLAGKCYPPIIMGQDIKSILGWNYLSEKYLQLVHQRDAALKLEECLSPETLHLAMASCKKAAVKLTVRIPLLPNIPDRHTLLQSLHESLKPILKDSISNLSTEEPYSFYYDSTIDNTHQRVQFEFITQGTPPHVSSADSMQLLLSYEYIHGQKQHPIVIDNTLGNQWCVDAMLKITRVYYGDKNLFEKLFECLRGGYDPRGHILGCIRNEIQNLDAKNLKALYDKCSAGHPATKVRLAQNALLLCQAASKIPLSDTEQSRLAEEMSLFITEVFGTIDAKTDLWHACLALLQQQAVSVVALESLLQLIGIAACRVQSKGSIDFMCSAPLGRTTLCIQDSAPGAECVLQVPLDVQSAIGAFETHSECANTLAGAIFKELGTAKKPSCTLQKALESVNLQPELFLSTTLLSAASGDTTLFKNAIKGLPKTVISSGHEPGHIIGAAMRLAFLAQGLKLTEQMQNGGLQDSEIESSWAAYLLDQPHNICNDVGQELLAGLEGSTPLKATWIYKSLQKNPELALRLIQQVADDPAIQESHVKLWLQKSPSNAQALIWHYLITLPTGRWLTFCATTCPAYVHEAFARGDVALCIRLQNALFTNEAPSDDFRSLLLPYVLHQDCIKQCPELIQDSLSLLENQELNLRKSEKDFIRTTLKSFVASAKKHSQHSLAMRFVKVHQLHNCGILDVNDKSTLVDCALDTLPQDLAEWYLTLRREVIPYKLEPARQCRAFLRIAQDHPGCLVNADSEYIRELYSRIQNESDKASLQEEISRLPANIQKVCKAFFPVKKEVRAPKQTKTAPVKKAPAKEESLLQKLHRLADSLSYEQIAAEICLLLKNKHTLSESTNRQIWRVVFENPHWLNSVQTLQVFEQLEFFKTLFVEPSKNELVAKKLQDHLAHIVEILLSLLKEDPKHSERYLPFAYKWFGLLPSSHAKSITLGLSLLDFCKPTDSAESLQAACAVVDELKTNLAKLCVQNATAKKQQRKKHTQPQEPALDGLIRFCIAARAPDALKVTHDTVLGLVKALSAQEAEAAHRFAINEFYDHPSDDIKEALWPSIKKMSTIEKSSPFAQKVEKARALLLNVTNLQLLLTMFEERFEVDMRNHFETPKAQPASAEYTTAYPRLLSLCCAAKEPQYAKRVLALDCNIREYYSKQAEAFQREVNDYSVLRLRLLLRVIQHYEWDKDIKRLFNRFIAEGLDHQGGARNCESFFVTNASPLFYSFDPQHPRVVGSISPNPKPTPTREPDPALHSLVYTGLRYACEKDTTLEQKKRLLDFTLQNIRNLIAHYPQVGFHSDCIKIFAKSVWPDEHLLWETHRRVVFGLLRAAFHKSIPLESMQELLEQIDRSVDELKTEDLQPLADIRKALLLVTADNVEQVLLEQQRALLLWQETQFTSSYDARQEVLDTLFRVWQAHPAAAANSSLIQGLAALIAPHGCRFGQHSGPRGALAAYKALESSLDLYSTIYNHIGQAHPQDAYRPVQSEMRGIVHYKFTKHGKLASQCLGLLVDEFAKATKMQVYSNNYDGFIEQAKKIMSLFKSPSYLSVVSISPLAGKLTTTLLMPVHEPSATPKKVALIHEWIQHISTHVASDDFYTFGDAVFQRIMRSDILMEFREPEYKTFARCLNRDGKKQLLALQSETIKKSQVIPINSLECLKEIYCSVVADDCGKSAIVEESFKSTKKTERTTLTISANGKIALSCLELMTDSLQKEAKSKAPDFSSYARIVMQLLAKPSYLGIQATSPLLGRIIDAIIAYVQQAPQEPQNVRLIHDWLQIVLSHRGDTGYKALLHHTMEMLIRGQLIKCFSQFGKAATQTLHSCLQDWQTSGIKISDELIGMLILQQREDEMLRGLDIAEKALDQLFEKLELDE